MATYQATMDSNFEGGTRRETWSIVILYDFSSDRDVDWLTELLVVWEVA